MSTLPLGILPAPGRVGSLALVTIIRVGLARHVGLSAGSRPRTELPLILPTGADAVLALAIGRPA